MASLRKKTPPAARRSLLSSAALISFNGAQGWAPLPIGDRRWQMEAWRQFDICGELHYGVTWKGEACGQATMYAARLDPDTGRPAGPAEDQRVQDVAAAVLGGPVQRGSHVSLMVKNGEVTGEVYVIIVGPRVDDPERDTDLWFTVSSSQLSQQGSAIEFVHPETGKPFPLLEGDKIIRVWSKHPQIQYCADSSVRSLLPVLREIEKASQNIAARLDSRIAGPGIMLTPQEADFADRDDSEAEETASLMQGMAEHM